MQLEQVKIKKVIGPTPAGAAVLLGNEKKTFVVFVGFYEAAALIREINRETPARPLTHELIQNIFLGFDVEVKSVVISAILESTFCATLILQQRVREGGEDWVPARNEVRIDARPSDCFVLALKNHVDILVTPEVFEQVQDITKMTKDVEKSLQTGMPFQPQGLGDIEFDVEGGPSASSFFGAAGEEAASKEAEDFSAGAEDEDEDEDEDSDDGPEDEVNEPGAADLEEDDEEDPFGAGNLGVSDLGDAEEDEDSREEDDDEDDSDDPDDADDTPDGPSKDPPRGWRPKK